MRHQSLHAVVVPQTQHGQNTGRTQAEPCGAHLLQVLFNKDSSSVDYRDWIQIARVLDTNRSQYDAFLVRTSKGLPDYWGNSSTMRCLLLHTLRALSLLANQSMRSISAALTSAPQHKRARSTCPSASLPVVPHAMPCWGRGRCQYATKPLWLLPFPPIMPTCLCM